MLIASVSVIIGVTIFELKILRIEESALTGESMPVEKGVAPVSADSVPADRLCIAFSDSLVVHC
jgi:magnesium-transporting ATPase (P-type)